MSKQSSKELRAGWRIARVGDILKVRSGYAFKSSDYKPEGVPIIRQSDLGDDVVKISQAKRVDPRFLSDLPGFVVRDGDLLIGMSGSLGKIAKYQHAEPALQNQRTGLLVLKSESNAKFAKLVLKYVEQQIVAEGKGIAVQNVSAKEIEDCTFPLPPSDEQHRIVAEIEKQFTRLEAGVAGLRRVQANLKRYRAAVLKAASEGKLVPTEAELARQEGRTFETGAQVLARILTERRQKWIGKGKYKEPAVPDTTKLPQLPEGWTYASVEQLGIVGEQPVLTGPFGTNLGREDFTETGVPVLTISCLKENGIYLDKAVFVSEEKAQELERYRLKPGDLLFSRMASVGRAGIVGEALRGALFNYHIMRLRLEPAVLLAKFYMVYVRGSAQVERYVRDVNHGATRDGINTEQLLNMPVALPPLAEQERIVAEVERRLSVVEELEAVVAANVQRAARLRQSILQRAFCGKL